ncbi:MAG: hypothetical protein NZ954_04605 [Thermofilaceae archaeon]|nr:hypothetical protein [Thermofilaceae archaeon]MCX8180087.1 hypothetical protein [Thermofilaceae archaeon]MDW8004258.1 hypothetical protein [Thermofilaceae archaeon]
MRKGAILVFSLGALVLAAVTITNISEWRVRASASPLLKLGNYSVNPISHSSFSIYDGLNVTAYTLRFVPGWVEEYAVGRLEKRIPELSTYLYREAQSGAASYWIYLGNVLQVSSTQVYGPLVSLPASLVWRSTATGSYWLLTTARFTVGGSRVQQLINFSARPLSLLYNASYGCATYARRDGFEDACTLVSYSFDTSIPNSRIYTYGIQSEVSFDMWHGNPAPSLYTLSHSGYAALFVNYSTHPFSVASSFSFQYFFRSSLQDTDYLQMHFFIDSNMDGGPDVEVIYYGSGGGTAPLPLAPVVYGRSLPVTLYVAPGFVNRANIWYTITIARIYSSGYVVGLAYATTCEKGMTKIWWDNVSFYSCTLPSYLSAYRRGRDFTVVYVDRITSPSTPPSLATQVDAFGSTGNPLADYGVAAAIYNVAEKWGTVYAAGFSFNVSGLYVRDATDVRNNVAYVSVGVDSDGNGLVDTEYFFYLYDIATGYSGAIVSVLLNPGAVVCTVGSGGSCTPTSPVYKVYNLGTMTSGSSYRWSGTVPYTQSGTVIKVAFAVTDASYWSAGTSDDFWVWWDDFAVAYAACTPLPPGWIRGDGTIYRPLVLGGIVYAGSFTGDGGFYLFSSGLSPLLGARRSGNVYYARCGGSETMLGSFTAAYYVDLRALSGLWEVILRDYSGNILARHGCAPAGALSYVGFTGVQGFELRVFGDPP